MRVYNFETHQNSDARMNLSKSSLSSTHRKSVKDHSNAKAHRPNLHSVKLSGFDHQHKGSIGEGICKVSDDDKMQSLS